MQHIINELKSLIIDYEILVDELDSMQRLWEDHDDPMSDPGLQFEKESEIHKAYKSILEFVKINMCD